MQSRAPSGLFPSGPPRPTFREPHPIRLGAVFAGAGAAVAWLLILGRLATTVAGYLWLTIIAAVVAWLCALVLMRRGDRGAAAGVAMATGAGVAVAVGVVVYEWTTAGWPLW